MFISYHIISDARLSLRNSRKNSPYSPLDRMSFAQLPLLCSRRFLVLTSTLRLKLTDTRCHSNQFLRSSLRVSGERFAVLQHPAAAGELTRPALSWPAPT
jgi:hypothetical protein